MPASSQRWDVALVSMPWASVHFPSIQLGILKQVLAGAGICAGVFPYNVRWVKFASERLSNGRFSVAQYSRIGTVLHRYGAGDWVFSSPSTARRHDYLEFLRTNAIDREDIELLSALADIAPAFIAACAEELARSGARVVGLTICHNQNLASAALATAIKEIAQSVQVVAGGANCDGEMGVAFLRLCPAVDVVVRGEAEDKAPQLFRELLHGDAITPQPGLCIRDRGNEVVIPEAAPTVVMDDVPTPNYDEYFDEIQTLDEYPVLAADLRLPFESARGCWYGEKHHCTFCGLNGAAMRFRAKSPALVVRSLQQLGARYRRLRFAAVDNILHMKYFDDLLPALETAANDLSIFYEVKGNLKKSHIVSLKAAGIEAIQPGLESLSTPILRMMDKGITAFQNVRLLKWCATFDVDVLWNILFGIPREPPEEYNRMTSVIGRLVHLAPPSFIALDVQRFSPYFKNSAHYGIEITGPAPFYSFLYDCSQQELCELAYTFSYRYSDGRDPASYTAGLSRAIERWRENITRTYGGLRVQVGPECSVISDDRNLNGREVYVLGAIESALYRLCDDGCSTSDIEPRLRKQGYDVTDADIADFIDALDRMELIYRESDQILALALPTRAAAIRIARQLSPRLEIGPGAAISYVPLRGLARSGTAS